MNLSNLESKILIFESQENHSHTHNDGYILGTVKRYASEMQCSTKKNAHCKIPEFSLDIHSKFQPIKRRYVKGYMINFVSHSYKKCYFDRKLPQISYELFL